jgi:syringomycin synthetase protein SyrE
LERRIRDAWREALHLDDVGLNDDFFALGGNSLRAMALAARLEATLSRPVSAATLYQSPTVARLAAALDEQADDESSPIVLLRDGDRARPLFFVHPLAGDAWLYRELSRRLSTDAAIFGLQLPDRDDAVELDDAALCAAAYVARLREMQPAGPYRLAGYSSGGMIAYEMARQFAAIGERVEFLGLIDAGVPPKLERRLTGTLYGRSRTLLRALPRLIADLRSYGIAEAGKRILRFIHRRRRGGFAGGRSAGGQFNSTGGLSDVQFLSCFADDISFFPARRLEQIRRHTQSVFQYEAGPLVGGAQLFRVGRQPLSAVPTTTLGWEALIDGPVDVYPIAGTHESVMRAPHVDDLAAALDRALAKLASAEA